MKLRIYSDLHHEFYTMTERAKMADLIPVMPDEDQQVFIFAGDVCVFESPSTYVLFFEEICERAGAVVYVPGNHEYYGGSLVDGERKFFSHFRAPSNFHWLAGGNTVDVHGVTFAGETLWTNFNNSAADMITAQQFMNDYRKIRTGTADDAYARNINAQDIFQQHQAAIERLAQNMPQNGVVVTHHSPSYLSVSDRYRGDMLNSSYATELGYWLMDLGVTPALWVHGHMHNSVDYEWCGSRVVTNPRGYPKAGANRIFENRDYNAHLVVEI